jgi:prolyl-tRNA synthetase
MKYRDLQIKTQREFPNNARTPGFGWLVRAGYLTRENEILPLGAQTLSRLQDLSKEPGFISFLSLPVISSETETYFPIATGSLEVNHCEACKYTERAELAKFKKSVFAQEEPLPMERVSTPDCSTIESLAYFLNLPKEKTAKALMYTRVSDQQFVFVVVRGDMNLSEAKLKNAIGEFRLATPEEIINAGATPGYASPIGLNANRALIVVDDLITESPNLAAGANEDGYHLLNTNCGRDYSAEIIADLVQVKGGDLCSQCGNPLTVKPSVNLAVHTDFNFENILLAVAETHHDDKGLTFPKSAAPFAVYLMHISGKEMDTHASAEELYFQLQNAGLTTLFDDRDERAGVKFNDSDLIGCPVRVTVGEKNLKSGMVEFKLRKNGESHLINSLDLIPAIQNLI